MCGDSRNDLNYSEFPDSWNDGEREKMEMGFAYNSDQVAMFRVKTLRGFELMIRAILERHEKPYRLFLSYKDTHRVKKVAGRLFVWDETEETRNGIDVEKLERRNDDYM